jgi:DNA-binding response OmpR family regulator
MIQVVISVSRQENGGAVQEKSGAILVVEDVFVRDFLRTTLSRRGYKVICAEAADALAVLREGPVRIDLLITNAPMSFAEFGDLPVLYLAACPDPSALQCFRRCLALRKPFHPKQLLSHIAQLLP